MHTAGAFLPGRPEPKLTRAWGPTGKRRTAAGLLRAAVAPGRPRADRPSRFACPAAGSSEVPTPVYNAFLSYYTAARAKVGAARRLHGGRGERSAASGGPKGPRQVAPFTLPPPAQPPSA